MSPRDKFFEDMRRDGSGKNPSCLDRYLNDFRSRGQEGAEAVEQLEADLMETFGSETGIRVLILFTKAALYAPVPDGSPESALREMNAVRNFVLNIRRLVAHG